MCSCSFCGCMFKGDELYYICRTCHSFLYEHGTELASIDSLKKSLSNSRMRNNAVIKIPSSLYRDKVHFLCLPNEVILNLFEYLDDLSIVNLCSCDLRFKYLVDSIPERKWAEHVIYRWPLFEPKIEIKNWKNLYFNMLNSATCRICLNNLDKSVLFPIEKRKACFKRRVLDEIMNVRFNPPEGIKLIPLDESKGTHCIACINGPPSSPYENGTFFLHIMIPDSHPLRPPYIRFITRILHPNISFHGDIGLDSISHCWSPKLTIEKILLSIQVLLTEPYTSISMEPSVSKLYDDSKDRFEELARLWTWKYACHDYLSPDFVLDLELPSYLKDAKME